MADLALSPRLFQSQQNQFPIKMTRSWEDMFAFQTYKSHFFSPLFHDNSSAGKVGNNCCFFGCIPCRVVAHREWKGSEPDLPMQLKDNSWRQNREQPSPFILFMSSHSSPRSLQAGHTHARVRWQMASSQRLLPPLCRAPKPWIPTQHAACFRPTLKISLPFSSSPNFHHSWLTGLPGYFSSAHVDTTCCSLMRI